MVLVFLFVFLNEFLEFIIEDFDCFKDIVFFVCIDKWFYDVVNFYFYWCVVECGDVWLLVWVVQCGMVKMFKMVFVVGFDLNIQFVD